MKKRRSEAYEPLRRQQFPRLLLSIGRSYAASESLLVSDERATGLDGTGDLLTRVHSFVVVSATREGVEVLDPQQGPRGLDIDEFLESWSPMNNLAIVIA